MDIYESIKGWVEQQVGQAAIDSCGHEPGSVGLFPQGVQLLRQWEDVTGRRRRVVRYRFLLRCIMPPGDDGAAMLLRLQEAAARTGYAATDGKLQKAGSDGLGIYEIRLSAEREEYL